jgi:hypothetical protein
MCAHGLERKRHEGHGRALVASMSLRTAEKSVTPTTVSPGSLLERRRAVTRRGGQHSGGNDEGPHGAPPLFF